MTSQLIQSLALGILLLLVTAFADARKTDNVDYQTFALIPGLATQVHVTHKVWAKEQPRGLAKLLPTAGAVVIRPGKYGVELGVRSGESEWLLVPYVLVADGMERSPDTSSNAISGCSSRFRRFLALDRKTALFAPRVFKVHFHRCDTDAVAPSVEGAWTQHIRFQESGKVEILGFRSIEEAAVAERARQDREWALVPAASAMATLDRSLKRQVGARLCKMVDQWQFVGFTEAISPDNGKLQIRVVDQRHAGTSRLRPKGFREQIVWEHPDHWTLCE